MYSVPDSEDWKIRGYAKCPAYQQRLAAWLTSDAFKQKEQETAPLRAKVRPPEDVQLHCAGLQPSSTADCRFDLQACKQQWVCHWQQAILGVLHTPAIISISPIPCLHLPAPLMVVKLLLCLLLPVRGCQVQALAPQLNTSLAMW